MTQSAKQSRVVLIADLNKLDIDLSIKSAIDCYRKLHGEPVRVWVNPNDVPDSQSIVSELKIERRGGCARGKVMVM